VFLPERTTHFGEHGSDKCYCKEIYGEITPWGCSWFVLWQQHVQRAVALDQTLQVFFWEGMSGEGKVDSWDGLADNAKRRRALSRQRSRYFEKLPDFEIKRITRLSMEPRDDSMGLKPGSARSDEEEVSGVMLSCSYIIQLSNQWILTLTQRLFMTSVSEEERRFFQSQKGLGDSQKAEVAWLDKMGYTYEEVDVRVANPLL
jgi:hypothetical protein